MIDLFFQSVSALFPVRSMPVRRGEAGPLIFRAKKRVTMNKTGIQNSAEVSCFSGCFQNRKNGTQTQ